MKAPPSLVFELEFLGVIAGEGLSSQRDYEVDKYYVLVNIIFYYTPLQRPRNRRSVVQKRECENLSKPL